MAGWAFFAGQPGALGVGDQAFFVVVEHVLTEVPDRPVVRLGVEVERDLLEASV